MKIVVIGCVRQRRAGGAPTSTSVGWALQDGQASGLPGDHPAVEVHDIRVTGIVESPGGDGRHAPGPAVEQDLGGLVRWQAVVAGDLVEGDEGVGSSISPS